MALMVSLSKAAAGAGHQVWSHSLLLACFISHQHQYSHVDIHLVIDIDIGHQPHLRFSPTVCSSSAPGFGECIECRWAFSSSHPPACKLWPNFHTPDALSDIKCHRCLLFIFFNVQYNINDVQWVLRPHEHNLDT